MRKMNGRKQKKNKMAKPKKAKKPEIKKNEIYKIVISCVLVLLFVLILGLVFKELSQKESKNAKNSSAEDISFYDADVCRCLERERLRCNEGFELDAENRLCRNVNGKEVTNVILACSKYECSGNIYEFNFENGKWETKTGE